LNATYMCMMRSSLDEATSWEEDFFGYG
jgi:hypothetical protein